MLANRVDATFSSEDAQAVMNAIQIIREKLHFAVGLSSRERKMMSKIGRKSQTFTEQALDMATHHPELIPSGIDLKGANRDRELFMALNPIVQALSEVYHLAEDTQMVAGSEAYAAARFAYKSAKTLGVSMGLDDVIEELSRRFQRSRSTSQSSD